MIDWCRVEELREEVGDEDFIEIVELFLAEIDESVGQLDGLGPGQDLADALHGIKGSALNLGFNAVATLCADGERDQTGFDHSCLKSAFLSSKAAVTDRYKSLL